MAKLLARRALQGVVIVWLVATLTFFLIALAPGDAVDVTYGGPFVPPQARAQIRQEFCLDRGIAVRYGCWVRSLAKGDLGWSIPLGRPVADVLADAIPNTILLMSLAIVATFALGIGTGVAQARRPGGKLDRIAGGIAMFLYALPDFWCALIVLFIFSYKLRWLPVTGMTDPVHVSVLRLLASPGRPRGASHPARGHARDRLRRGHLTLPARGDDRCDVAGLRPHRAREGAGRGADPAAPRAPQRPAAGHHALRLLAPHPARRRRAHRAHLLLARHGAARHRTP